MEQRLKICLGCGKPQKLFSHGYCLKCYAYSDFRNKNKANKPRSTPKTYKDTTHSEKDAFKASFLLWKGLNFLTGKQMVFTEVVAGNFAHVLRKGGYIWFRYYPNNIVLLTFEQHRIFDQGSHEQMLERAKEFPHEDWLKLIMYEKKMKKEYEEWTRDNIKTYKV